MSPGDSVIAIIPVWNSANDLSSCLKSLLKLNYKKIRFLVADNNSTDNTDLVIKTFQEAFNRSFISLEHLKLDDNYGPTGAMNKALKIYYKDEKYILRIDSDIEIDDVMVIDKMLLFLDSSPRAGIVGPKMLVPAFNQDIVATYWVKLIGTIINKEKTYPSIVDMANAGFVMIKAELYKKLGFLWSKILFYSWEELDLSERAKALGYSTFYCPNAAVVHKIKTMRCKNERQIYYDFRNLLLVNWKYGSIMSRFVNFVILFFPRMTYWFFLRSRFKLSPLIRATKDFFLLRKIYMNEQG